MGKITHEIELAGKTIRWAGDSEDGRDLVLVFDNNDWAVLTPADDFGDDAHVEVCHLMDRSVTNYLSPGSLLRAELITQSQYEFMLAEEKKKESERLRKHAATLVAKADAIDREAA